MLYRLSAGVAGRCDTHAFDPTKVKEGADLEPAPFLSLVSDVFHVRREPPLISERIGHGSDPVAIGLFCRFL